MQPVETLHYCRVCPTLLSWHGNSHLGVGIFYFVFSFFLFACFACVILMTWLPRIAMFVVFVCTQWLALFFLYVFRPGWSPEILNTLCRYTAGRHGRWHAVIACPLIPTFYAFAGNTKYRLKSFICSPDPLVYKPFWCTSRKLQSRYTSL